MKSWIHAGLIFAAGATALAGADDGNRSLLIEKLGKVQSQLAPKDPSKVSVTLRLADLLAERARVESMEELEKGCTVCNGGEADRKKALRLYLEVLGQAPEASQSKVMIQVGHLYQLTGAEDKAVQFYNQVLAGKPVATLQAEANLSLAEIHFKRRQFDKAIAHYAEVLKNEKANSRGLAAYRSAWSHFNSGRVSQAILQVQEILKTPALLSRTGAPGAPVDPQFQDEVSRDLVTFLAKNRFEASQIQSLFDLSPEKLKQSNLQTLAREYERLGQKTEALQVWNFIYPFINKPEDRLAALISISQMEFDGGRRKQALEKFEKSMELWRENKGCGQADCEESRKRARQFVVGWNQLEKKQVSEELLTAYDQYTQTFPSDADMLVYSSKVAEDLKKYPVALSFNSKAIQVVKASGTDSARLETLLLKQMELAELSQDEQLQTQAGDLYLASSPKKTKAFEVQYQKARLKYEKGQYADAVTELRALALSGQGEEKVRIQAADLSLDGLVLLKDESRLSAWAQEYSQAFKNNATEYQQIVQKSILTRSANLAEKDTKASYNELSSFNPAQATAEDRLKYYKNKLILAEKLKKIPEAMAAAEGVLSQSNASLEDREMAWGRKAYLSEMLLDFSSAMAATEKIEKALSLEEKTLKVALFAELSGGPSETYYQKYLKVSADEEKKRLVAAELVKKSKQPAKELLAQKNVLEKSPALLAGIAAEVYAKTSDEAVLKMVQKDEKLKGTESGKLLERVAFLKKFNELKAKLNREQLVTGSDKKLAQSIKTRAALLQQLESMTAAAIASGDWTSQLVSLHLFGTESERFYSELMSAPVPAGLHGEEEQQYLSLLATQAAPYQNKALAAKSKTEEFWKNTTWAQSLEQAWKQVALRPLLSQEVSALKDIAPEASAKTLASLQSPEAGAAATKPNPSALLAARKKVYQSPYDSAAIEELLKLEKQFENTAMVQYLETRLQNLGKEIQ